MAISQLRMVALAIVSSVAPMTLRAGTLDHIVQVSAGDMHTCAVTDAGNVTCWGDDTYGQLGDGNINRHAYPSYVIQDGYRYDRAVQVAAGGTFTCARRDDGGVDCWGAYGIADSDIASLEPVAVAFRAPVKILSASFDVVCGVLDNAQRAVQCWGQNEDGQLGDGTTTSRNTPADVVVTEKDGTQHPLTDVIDISAGSDHVCAVLADTTVACWGLDWLGELGDGATTRSTSPHAVIISGGTYPKLSGIVQISANGLHTCGRFSATWMVTCWGSNSQGQLGDPDVAAYTISPVSVAVGALSVQAGLQDTCARLADDRVACWGDGTYGQIGDGVSTGSRVPLIASISSVVNLSLGSQHACAVL